MAAKEMGVVYSRTSDGNPLRRAITPEERDALIGTYYIPHHERLSMAVGEALSAHAYCLIIDAHSFSSKPLPYEPDQRTDRPAICIGTDDFHTPQWLADLAVELFRAQFGLVEVNRPFGGTIVPTEYLRKNRRVYSIMIEFNRALYMDERTGSKLPNYDDNKERLKRAISQLIDLIGEKT